MKKQYKIMYQDNMTTYYLNNIFLNEDDAWNYIDDNGLNVYQRYYSNVEWHRKQGSV